MVGAGLRRSASDLQIDRGVAVVEPVVAEQPFGNLEQGRRVERRRERDGERIQSPLEPPQVSRGFEEPAVPRSCHLVHAVAEQKAPIVHGDGRPRPIHISAVQIDDHPAASRVESYGPLCFGGP